MADTAELTVVLPCGLMEAFASLPEHELMDQAGPCWLVRITPTHLAVVGPDAQDEEGSDAVDAMISRWCFQPGWYAQYETIGDTAVVHLHYESVAMRRLL